MIFQSIPGFFLEKFMLYCIASSCPGADTSGLGFRRNVILFSPSASGEMSSWHDHQPISQTTSAFFCNKSLLLSVTGALLGHYFEFRWMLLADIP